MMSPRARGARAIMSLYVPSTPQYRYAARSTGSSNRRLVQKMERLLQALASDQRWDVLNAVHEKRVTLAKLWDAHARNAVDALVTRVQQPDLATHIPAWLTSYRAQGGAANNVAPYAQRVKVMVPPGTVEADITPAAVRATLTALEVTSGTRRHYLMALKSFLAYLKEAGVISGNPLADFRPPRKNPPRKRWASLETDQRFVASTTDPQYRALFAFVHGTGADVSAVIEKMIAGDLDLTRGVGIVRATKTGTRDRHVIIEPWAIPYIRAWVANLLPSARVFPEITRYRSADHHRRTGEACGVLDYQARDARHSIAVRWLRAGRTVHEVAEQLGTSPYQIFTTYGNQELSLEERLTSFANDTATSTATRPLTRSRTRRAV